MVHKCCVYGCNSNYQSNKKDYQTVFSFPKDEEKCEEWKRRIPNKNLKVTKSTRVCIKHFDEKDIKRYDVFPCANGDPDIMVSTDQYYTIIAIKTICSNIFDA